MRIKLKNLRTNKGLEFVLERFNEFRRKKIGIKKHKTVVGTPQQNDLVKHINMNILE